MFPPAAGTFAGRGGQKELALRPPGNATVPWSRPSVTTSRPVGQTALQRHQLFAHQRIVGDKVRVVGHLLAADGQRDVLAVEQHALRVKGQPHARRDLGHRRLVIPGHALVGQPPKPRRDTSPRCPGNRNPVAAASPWATELLPAPAGPSMVTIMAHRSTCPPAVRFHQRASTSTHSWAPRSIGHGTLAHAAAAQRLAGKVQSVRGADGAIGAQPGVHGAAGRLQQPDTKAHARGRPARAASRTSP